ncbi:hypothetical protein BGX26_000746 [Mortierella sp. AD094]|nr:hypothetical protein BGX26_000746 [Mortierella sp. AD094]
MALLQSAPRQLRVSAFFHNNPATQWHEVPKFLKSAKRGQTADALFQLYKSSLETIASSDSPKDMRRRAREIADNITSDVFKEQCEDYSLSGKKRQAENAMLSAFYDVIKGAGSKSLTVPTADINTEQQKSPALKRKRESGLRAPPRHGTVTAENLSDKEDTIPRTPPHQSSTSASASTSTLESGELPASRMFSALHQKTEWINNIDIGAYFSNLRGKFRQPFDISHDNIMDLTSASEFILSMDDTTYNAVMQDLPGLEVNFPEFEELNEIMGEESCFEDLKNMIYNLPLNTPVRRYLYGVIES